MNSSTTAVMPGESAIKMHQVTKSMGSVVKVMDQFERSFEDMDVRSEYVEGAMNSSTTAVMPEEQVDELMQMVADEHGLKMSDVFKTAAGATDISDAGEQSSSQGAVAAAAGGGGGGGGGGTSTE